MPVLPEYPIGLNSLTFNFFTVPTATFRVMCILLILKHDRRHKGASGVATDRVNRNDGLQ